MSKPDTKRLLTAAEKKRRRQRQLLKRYAKASAGLEGHSEIERQCPVGIDQQLLRFGVEEVRFQLRSGSKGVYGAHIAKSAETIFGKLAADHRQFFVSWINWLVRNRTELTMGRYATKVLDKTIAAMVSSNGPSDLLLSAVTDLAPGVQELPESGVSATPGRLSDPLPPGHESAGKTSRDRPERFAESRHRPDTGPSDIEAAKKFGEPSVAKLGPLAPPNGGGEGSGEVHRPRPGAGGGQQDDVGAQRQEGFTFDGNPSPKRPAKFDFKFTRDGESEANAFFGSIFYDEPVKTILANACTLAQKISAVRKVQARGPIEANYLAQAMADLGVELP